MYDVARVILARVWRCNACVYEAHRCNALSRTTRTFMHARTRVQNFPAIRRFSALSALFIRCRLFTDERKSRRYCCVYLCVYGIRIVTTLL